MKLNKLRKRKLVEDEKTHEMYILVISARADNEVYEIAGKRK